MKKDKESSLAYKSRKYIVVPYNPNWVSQFETLAEEIRSVFRDKAIKIEHIGSTSVPGMEGKPIIDILIVVNDITDADVLVHEMERLRYSYAGQYLKEESRLYRKMSGTDIIANLQVFDKTSQSADEIIKLRDYLRSNTQEVEAYTHLKKSLFSKHKEDYSQYRKLKDEYMVGLKQRALDSFKGK